MAHHPNSGGMVGHGPPYFYCDGLVESHVGLDLLPEAFRAISDNSGNATQKPGKFDRNRRYPSQLQLMRFH